MARKSIFEIPHYYIKLKEVKEEAKDTFTFSFEHPEEVTWGGGDHAHFVIPDEEVNERSVRHLSMISLPHERRIDFTTRLRGELSYFKEKLKNMKIGDEILVAGFVGNFRIIRDGKPLVFISQGVAIATIYALVKEFVYDNSGIGEIESININPNNEFIFEEKLNEYKEIFSNFNHTYVNNRNDFYESLTNISKRHFDNAYYFVVGDKGFMEAVELFLQEKDIKNIITDTHNNNHPYKIKRNY